MSEQPQFIRDVTPTFRNAEVDGAYSVDHAGAIDRLEDWMRDEWLVSERQAKLILAWHRAQVDAAATEMFCERVGQLFCYLLESFENLKVAVYAFLLATGMDELNGVRSQAEVARICGVTRALVSVYVLKISDFFGFKVLNFRKRNETREVFSQSASRVHAAMAHPDFYRHKHLRDRLALSQKNQPKTNC